jgi:hypothetical protein
MQPEFSKADLTFGLNLLPTPALKITPSIFLKQDSNGEHGFHDYQDEEYCGAFNFNVQMPSKMVMQHSPLMDSSTHLSGYSSDCNNDAENDLRNRSVTINGIVLRDYMTSNNLNECVTALLRKEKVVVKNVKRVIRYNPTGKEKEKKKRLRKNKS